MDVDCQRVLIGARVRPVARHEGECRRVEVHPASGTIWLHPAAEGPDAKRRMRRFVVDRIFPPESAQAEVYRGTAASAVFDVLQGLNSVILAYGMTGAGKTYTMFGPEMDGAKVTANDAALLGVVPRAVFELFEAIDRRSSTWNVEVYVSFLQLYMGSVQDLLARFASRQSPAGGAAPSELAGLDLAIREGPQGTFVEGLTEHRARRVEDVLSMLHEGARHRVVAATSMNRHSSRGHTVFSIRVRRRLQPTEPVSAHVSETSTPLEATLTFVDLAGSERIHRTGADGATLEEAKDINRSLSALGGVVAALSLAATSASRDVDLRSDRSQSLSASTAIDKPFIPWRDSKLTRLLHSCVRGRCTLTLIVTLAPADIHAGETLSSLLFAARARGLGQRPGEAGLASLGRELGLDAAELLALGVGGASDFRALAHRLQRELDEERDRRRTEVQSAAARMDALVEEAEAARREARRAQAAAEALAERVVAAERERDQWREVAERRVSPPPRRQKPPENLHEERREGEEDRGGRGRRSRETSPEEWETDSLQDDDGVERGRERGRSPSASPKRGSPRRSPFAQSSRLRESRARDERLQQLRAQGRSRWQHQRDEAKQEKRGKGKDRGREILGSSSSSASPPPSPTHQASPNRRLKETQDPGPMMDELKSEVARLRAAVEHSRGVSSPRSPEALTLSALASAEEWRIGSSPAPHRSGVAGLGGSAGSSSLRASFTLERLVQENEEMRSTLVNLQDSIRALWQQQQEQQQQQPFPPPPPPVSARQRPPPSPASQHTPRAAFPRTPSSTRRGATPLRSDEELSFSVSEVEEEEEEEREGRRGRGKGRGRMGRVGGEADVDAESQPTPPTSAPYSPYSSPPQSPGVRATLNPILQAAPEAATGPTVPPRDTSGPRLPEPGLPRLPPEALRPGAAARDGAVEASLPPVLGSPRWQDRGRATARSGTTPRTGSAGTPSPMTQTRRSWEEPREPKDAAIEARIRAFLASPGPSSPPRRPRGPTPPQSPAGWRIQSLSPEQNGSRAGAGTVAAWPPMMDIAR